MSGKKSCQWSEVCLNEIHLTLGKSATNYQEEFEEGRVIAALYLSEFDSWKEMQQDANIQVVSEHFLSWDVRFVQWHQLLTMP